MSSKILIAYFSHAGNNYVGGSIVNLTVGNTEVACNKIKALTGADLFKLDPVNTYSVDYRACVEESKKELKENARPELKEYLSSIDGYDTIIVAYPCWCGTIPMPVFTFLDRYDFSGKTILPLCTNEGSGMGRSEGDIKRLCPHSCVKSGLPLIGGSVDSSDGQIKAWLENNHII